MLNVLAKCENWIQRANARQIGSSVISWFLNERVTQVTKDVDTFAQQLFADN